MKSLLDQTQENLAIVRQYFAYFNEHAWASMGDMYQEQAEFKDPSFGNGIVMQSKAEIIAKYEEMSHLFPDLRDEVVQLYPSGDKHVIVEFVSSGTAPDGTAFELPICTIFTIEAGKITRDFTYYNDFEA